MIVLWLLILRGISIEFRNHIERLVWHPLWDAVFAGASALQTRRTRRTWRARRPPSPGGPRQELSPLATRQKARVAQAPRVFCVGAGPRAAQAGEERGAFLHL